jgi:hypothetical protein
MTGSNHWVYVLSEEELDDLYETTASIDPSFAAASRRFWETRTENELSALIHQAWLTNDGDQYQLARSYRARTAEDSLPTTRR